MAAAWPKSKETFPLSATWDSETISQVQPEGVVRICWRDVETVIAYKKDCYTFDQIRLVIAGKGRLVECGEGDQNMAPLEGAVLQFLPGSLPGWYVSLASTAAFDTSLNYVYRRRDESNGERDEGSDAN